MKTAFLFPGQGAQQEGMIRQVRPDEIRKEIVELTEKVLGEPADGLDTGEKLRSTAYVQVCLLITGVISARRLLAENVEVDFVAGHSIGAFTAAVICGSLSFEDALRLVYIRGTLMQQAYPVGYGMAALVGLRERTIREYIGEHNKTNDTIYLANINTADQMVVAGKLESLQMFISSVQSSNLRKAKILNMSVPSHCELLAGVSSELKEKLSMINIETPLIAYVADCTGRLLKTAEEVRTDLWKSVANTVRWFDGTSLLYELGVRTFIEVEPSGVLAKMTEMSFPDAKVIALEEGKTKEAAWLWKNYQQENL